MRAACTTCGDFNQAVPWGTAAISALSEASGIAASARNFGVLWTHNDGTKGKMYSLSTNGALLATFDLTKSVDDVEDVAVGPGPSNGVWYLYAGDIGGNTAPGGARSSVQILRIPEPPVDLAWASSPRTASFTSVNTFTLVYPDGSYDAEALMVDPLSSDVLVVTKQNGVARFYRANLNAATNNATLTMEFVREVFFHQASGGDISPDGSQIILRRENFAQLWSRCDGEPISNAFDNATFAVPVVGPPTEPNGEGIGFLRDGTGYVTISEEADPVLYFFQAVCPAPPKFTITLSNQSAVTGSSVAFRAAASGYPRPEYSWQFSGQLISNQTNSSLVLSNLVATNAGLYQIVASNASGLVTNSATLTVRARPDLRITEAMSSEASGASVTTGDWWELTSFESQPLSLAGWRFNDNSGGLTDPFVLPSPLSIAPGESIIFADTLTPAQFRAWWGASNLPPALQIVTYSGSGYSLSSSSDGVRLWDNTTTDTNDVVALVNFSSATAGVSFNYDPVTQQFGAKSQLGVNGVFRAAAANDIGSPGRIITAAVRPTLRSSVTNGLIRIEFDVAAGHRYALEARDNFTSAAWAATGDSFQATNSARGFFAKDLSAQTLFFRVKVD